MHINNQWFASLCNNWIFSLHIWKKEYLFSASSRETDSKLYDLGVENEPLSTIHQVFINPCYMKD